MKDRLTPTRRHVLAGGVALTAGAVTSMSSQAAGSPQWDIEVDVAVIGSGAAGMTAALYAREAGANVVLFEKAGAVGGTSAKSGGSVWIPNNFDMKSRGLADEKADFLRYAARYSFPVLYDPNSDTLGLSELNFRLLSTFYDEGSATVDDLIKKGVGFAAFQTPGTGDRLFADYGDTIAENKAPVGRVLNPVRLGGGLGAGKDLMAALKRALDQRSVPIHRSHEVSSLITSDTNAVIGCTVTREAKQIRVKTRRGVIFATGGFTQNRELLRRFHRDPVFGGCGVPTNTGDFIGIASDAGAELANMANAWRVQVVLEEALRYQSLPNEVWTPGGDSVFFVNRFGKRYVNEKRNYHDRAKASYAWDPNSASYPNLLAFMIYDKRTAEQHGGFYPYPDEPEGADYVIKGQTLEKLAQEIDKRLAQLGAGAAGVRLDSTFIEGLTATTSRFAEFSKAGRDADFGRGEFPWDKTWGSVSSPSPGTPWPSNDLPNPTMYPLQAGGPYYAIILAPGTLDTNGGPVIDEDGRVLDRRGQPISGLFGAGNCIASPAGDAYWGAGATLGCAIVFGARAGKAAARLRSSTDA